jgi:membrane-associated phospholipid phosphatase
MKQRIAGAAACLLLILIPHSVFARGSISEEPKFHPARDFSLTIRYAPAARTIPTRADFSAPPLSTPAAADKFTLRSLSHDFLKDAGEIWSYPVHIRARDILPIAGFAVMTGFLIANDEAISRWFRDYRDNHAWVRAVSPVITEMGATGAWGTVAAFLCVGLIAKDNKAIGTADLALNALLQSGIVVTFLKGMTGRQRPFYANGVDHWSGPVGFFKRFGKGQYGRYDSFPGGHSATAFALATVVAMQYRKSVLVPILAYSTATGVGLSRMTEKKHWLSSVFVGAVLGHVIGRMVVLNHRRR